MPPLSFPWRLGGWGKPQGQTTVFGRAELNAKQLEEIRAAVNGGFALGNERFKTEIAAMLGRRVQPGVSGRPKKGSKR